MLCIRGSKQSESATAASGEDCLYQETKAHQSFCLYLNRLQMSRRLHYNILQVSSSLTMFLFFFFLLPINSSQHWPLRMESTFPTSNLSVPHSRSLVHIGALRPLLGSQGLVCVWPPRWRRTMLISPPDYLVNLRHRIERKTKDLAVGLESDGVLLVLPDGYDNSQISLGVATQADKHYSTTTKSFSISTSPLVLPMCHSCFSVFLVLQLF